MKNYLVVSPLISVTIPVMDDGSGPEEVYRCVVKVAAPNKREAIKSAVKSPEMRDWVNLRREDGASPFIGLKAEAAHV